MSSQPLGSTEATTTGSVVRVLIVDDDPDDLLIMRALLGGEAAKSNYEVDVAQDWDTALRKLKQGRHDVALIDYLLGARTGLELVRSLAGEAGAPPMILLTGYAGADIDQQAIAAGAVDYIEKNRLDALLLDRTLRFAIERDRFNRELGARERMWKLLFATNPLAMWLYRPEGLRIVEVNQAACAQYGYDRDEFLKLTLHDLRPPRERERLHAFMLRADLVADQADAGKWIHQRKDGGLIHVQVFRSDIELGDQRLRLAIVKDITAEVTAEERLRRSEETLRGVLRDLGDGLIVINRDNTVEFANESAHVLLERTALVGSSIESDGHFTSPGEIELRSPGRSRVLDIRVNPTNWLGTDATAVLLRDVSVQRANERKLALLQRSVESANEGLLIVDARSEDHPILYTNPAFERITGYSSSEAVGRNCRFLQAHDTDQPAVAEMRQALESETHCAVTLRNYRKDGGLFWSRLTISPVRNTRGDVTHFIGIISDITEQRQLEERRRFLESHDAVTGLPRFSGWEAELNQLLEKARDRGESVAALFVDIDSFHAVNDTLGYAMGDVALRLIAERLRGLGPRVEVTRYAGDEFLLLLPGAARDIELAHLARELSTLIARPLEITPGASLDFTCSVGATRFPEAAGTLQELVHQADLAMNRAKREGRNAAVVYTSEMSEALHDRLALGARLRSAIARNEFVMYYQPQVDAHDNSVLAVEALVRWQSPEFGLLPPKRFVPIAENCGLIVPLGMLVLRSACQQVASWLRQGLRDFRVSVNASAAQIHRPEFVEDVKSVLEEYSIPPEFLEIEITESMLMEHSDRIVRHLHALKSIGIRLAVDDFGIGYSSLAYLRRFPVDKLKIDQSFIDGLISDSGQAAVVRAIISMGHHLGLRVLAEGVETLQQSEFLRRCQCDELQGFYYSPPVPADEVPGMLERRFLGAQARDSNAAAPVLLLVDDEENILRALVRLLRRDGYRIFTATSAAAAFEILAVHDIHVVLSDQRMPGMDGTEFLRRVKEMYPRTVRMVLSGFTDLATVTEAINRGAIYKFLTKPWEDDSLREQVREAFRRHATELWRET